MRRVKAYTKKHRGVILFKQRAYYHAHSLERSKYLADHRNEILAKKKVWRNKNRKKIRAYNTAHKNSIRQNSSMNNLLYKLCAIMIYGGECAACGETDLAALTMDHVNNDGHLDRQRNFYRTLVGGSIRADLQVLCQSCQWRKMAYGDNFKLWKTRAILTDKDPIKAIEARNLWRDSVEYLKIYRKRVKSN